MGCSASKTSAKIAPQVSPTPGDTQQLSSNDHNGVTPTENTPQIKETNKQTGVIGSNNAQTVSEQASRRPQDRGNIVNKDKPKGVTFDIPLTGSDKLLTRRPHKLQKLESAPELTVEMLAQKMAAAEKNRQKELEKKAKKTSKRRKELHMAQEMDNDQQQMAEKMVRQIEEKMTATDRNRAKAQAEIVAKQKKREDRAKKVRDKARKIQEGDDIVHVTVDPDQTYNADVNAGDMWDDATKSQSSSESWDNRNAHNIDETIQDKQETILAAKDHNMNSVHEFFD